MFFVYILTSQKDDSRYIGMTTDVERRLREHNHGGAEYTSAHAPYDLRWYCGFQDKNSALEFEKYLKSGSGHAFVGKHLLS